MNTFNIFQNRNIDVLVKKESITYEIPVCNEIKQIGAFKSVEHRDNMIVLEYTRKDHDETVFNLDDYSYLTKFR